MKRKKPYAQRLLPLIILAVIGYTIAAFILQFYTSIEISPTLTTLYFGFWTVEVVNLAVIKRTKTKSHKSAEREEEHE